MGKILSWVVLVALGFLALKLIAIGQRKRELAEQNRAAREAEQGGKAPRVAGEMMVQCAHCGVFVPASDALVEGERAWCSRAHRDADRARQPRQ